MTQNERAHPAILHARGRDPVARLHFVVYLATAVYCAMDVDSLRGMDDFQFPAAQRYAKNSRLARG